MMTENWDWLIVGLCVGFWFLLGILVGVIIS
jgi:hypothetical protein